MSEKTFESAMSELETIVKKLENGTGTLEESLVDFESAVSLVKYCTDTLKNAEKKLTVLTSEEMKA